SRESVALRVRAWSDDGRETPWSAPLAVEAGLLSPSDWRAAFVTPDWDEPLDAAQPAPLLRREFELRPGLARARLYATALGVYELEINGRPVGEEVLAPGWTSYG